MKKILLTVTTFIALSLTAQAQYWYIPHINAGQNPGNLNNDAEQPSPTGWATVQTTSATPVYSAIQPLPFTFNLNGTPFTQYIVSTSGVLTFTTASTGAPSSTSASLPDATIPDNSICVWGLAATGSNDAIISKTFGTAPNRQFWVQFNSFSCPVISGGFTYWSIVLEETTNKVYVVDQRSYNATLALSIGIQLNATTAYEVTGSPTLGSNATVTADPTPIDNSYYEFIPGVQPSVAVSLLSITPAANSQAGFGAVSSSNPITGTILNLGTSPITSFSASYNAGAGAVTTNITGVNIASFAQYTFTCTPSYIIPAPSAAIVNVYVDLAGDTDHSNDTLSTTITGYSFMPTHRVVFEEATGTWCGWCPRGAVFMDSMYIMNKATTVEIAVHNSDPMTNTAYDAGVSAAVTGYPSILVDRFVVDDPGNAFVQYAAHIGDFGMADLTCTSNFDQITRLATASVTAKMACTFANNNANNDYRLAVVFTEMGVTGTTAAYDQHDYYSSTSQNQPLTGAGHNWQLESDPVSHTKMVFDFVARTMIGGFTGLANSLPNSVVAGTTYNGAFTYTVPSTYNAANMKAHVLLIDAKNGIIYNGISSDMVLGMNTIEEGKQEFTVFPNPAENILSMRLKMHDADNAVTVSFINFLGQVVHTETIGRVVAGDNAFTFDVSNLPAGAYFVNVTTSKGTASTKFIK
jgi:hypothetical protein